jgi:hypothetical protein
VKPTSCASGDEIGELVSDRNQRRLLEEVKPKLIFRHWEDGNRRHPGSEEREKSSLEHVKPIIKASVFMPHTAL